MMNEIRHVFSFTNSYDSNVTLGEQVILEFVVIFPFTIMFELFCFVKQHD